MKIDWINSWNAGNKKEFYELALRVGTVTVLQARYKRGKFRFMILNFGFEL